MILLGSDKSLIDCAVARTLAKNGQPAFEYFIFHRQLVLITSRHDQSHYLTFGKQFQQSMQLESIPWILVSNFPHVT